MEVTASTLSGAVVLSAVFLLAGAVKGITGMGLPTVAVSLLTLWLTPTQAAALIVVPSLLTNVAQCRGPSGRELVRLLWPAWVALAVMTVLVPNLPDSFSGRVMLGAVLVAYGLWGLWRPQLPNLAPNPVHGTIAGAATGLLTALTAVFVMPIVPYLQALRLDKDTLVQALGLTFTVATVALAVRLHSVGELDALSADTALVLLAAFVGMGVGSKIRAGISAAMFQRALFAALIGLGAANLLR